MYVCMYVAVAMYVDGRFLASASFDKKIKLWCGRTGNFLATLTGHVGSVYQVSAECTVSE